jgi:hypothetical protein
VRAAGFAAVVSAAIWSQVERAMSKWKYYKAGDFVPPGANRIIPGTIKTKLLLPAADAFIANAFRIHSIWKLKPDLVEHACVTMSNVCKVTYQLTGHVDTAKALKDDPDFPNKLQKKIEELVESVADPESFFFDSQRAIERLEKLLDNYPSAWDEGFRATLASMLTGAWTAFEVLASDLWEAALNAHPRTLCELSGKKDRISRKAGAIGREKEEEKTDEHYEGMSEARLLQNVKRITRGTFNAGELMGTILKEKFPFHKLAGIRKAYTAAFSSRFEKIDEILADKSLDKLNLVRNLFLHKGGIIEEKFVRGAKEIGWSYVGQFEENLPLDGQLVSDLIRPVFDRAIQLVVAVDQWITQKPETEESSSDADDDS